MVKRILFSNNIVPDSNEKKDCLIKIIGKK